MFDCIGIASKSIEKSIHFYSLLDLEFQKYGDDHYEANTESGVRIMLDSHKLLKEINPNFSECKNPTTTMGFKFSTPQEVDQAYKRIIDEKYISIKEPWDAFWGQRYASVVDPDGNQIDLFAPLE